ncbi:MAG: PEP-CTERM sorting domain-containing protein [Aquabacterium sp.]|uniref:PEP-CTERM sorting domain-containing protein n=1 Tax=Aquabacterium sp. TaxID=1872578 RepID=UPI0012130D36|nr:PEP-CTERM sorting domain-containing protein [Aquabacterium sp.]TAK91628.1 MAG: PEP-CTERM sorting domain-containing protein [Aquabacterium sp.]
MRSFHAVLSAIGAALSLAATAAHAQATFTWGLSAEEMASQTYNYASAPSPYDTFTTGGVQSVTSGQVAASVNAWADPTTGMFKSITSVQMSGDTPINIAESYARMDIYDTIRLTGPGATARLTITLDYDTTFAGLGMTPFQRYQQIDHFMQADSSRYVSAEYTVANPDFDPNATCTDYGSDGISCPLEAMPTLTKSQSASKDLFREWALGGPNGVYSNGDAENGRYTGQTVLTFDAPTNTDIALNFQLYNGSRCFHLANCSLSTDASHSDYLGIKLEDGVSFTSANGYQYLGAPSAVPEPSALLLLSTGGLLLLNLQRRRR